MAKPVVKPSTPVVMTRPLSKTKAATRRKLIEAASVLATEGGYEAVGMREVAAAAGMSPATVYQYYGSKDHLLVDVLVELDRESTDALDHRRLPDGSPADRVVTVLRRAIRRMERAPGLYSAVMRAYISGGTPMDTSLGMLLPKRNWIEIALGDVEDREVILHIIQDAYLAAMVQLISGLSPEELVERIEQIVRRVVPDVAPNPETTQPATTSS